jgi:inorganic pyrophosphatase
MKNNDPHLLSNLPAFNEDGSVHAVVEAPKGSLIKLKYEIKLGVFTVSHSLPLGLSYPFDWGFVPSTQAPDGDPLDILILHEGSTYPGVVLPCRPLGVVEMDQEDQEGRRERNDRVIVMPSWHDRLEEFENASDLPERMRITQVCPCFRLFPARVRVNCCPMPVCPFASLRNRHPKGRPTANRPCHRWSKALSSEVLANFRRRPA